ncbi:NAD-binding protein [Pigmentiphaga soli]|uniref:NAD-binding protein n=1 Tax=Pigmentiphaga soli TaxID=1007095 RepID=A0ABP8GEH9_9BURK
MNAAAPAARRPGRRAPRLLIVGCGDTGMQVLRRLAARMRVFALTSSAERLPELRAAGALPLLGDLDRRTDLARLRGLAPRVLMLAPPPASGRADTRSAHLAAVLRRPPPGFAGRAAKTRARTHPAASGIVAKRAQGRAGPPPRRLVYASTTGVYGDAGGARLRETDRVAPASERAARRVAAERLWRGIAPARARSRAPGLPAWRTTVLRIPGIYGIDRLPLDRLRRGLPRLAPDDDVFTNHIEIGDLAAIAVAALWRGRPQRVLHACDGEDLKMGDYFDAVADAAGLPRPPRLGRDAVQAAVSPAMWSFMRESRRLDNERLRRELRVRLRYPTVAAALRQWFGKPAA